MTKGEPKRSEFYISPDGDSSDGLTAETAWQDFDSTQWVPNSNYYVMPGEYYHPIEPTCGNVNILGLGCTDVTPAIFHGSRSALLPECGALGHSADNPKRLENGAEIRHAGVTIDGRALQGFVFKGWVGNGIRCYPGARAFTLCNTEIYNCGWVALVDGWDGVKRGEDIVLTRGAGLLIADEEVVAQDCIIHDNGEDNIQSAHGDNGLGNLTLSRYWGYNAIPHSEVTGEAKNWGTHTDGLQIYDGGSIKRVVAIDCWFGPGHTNSLVLGDVGTDTTVRGVTLRHCTLDRPADNALLNNPPQKNHNHIYDRITIAAPFTKHHAILNYGNNIKILDSIVEGRADVNLFGSGHTFRGNHASGVGLHAGTESFGETHDETLFLDANTADAFALTNYTPRAYAGNAGSRNHRVQDIFGLGDREAVGPDEFGCYRFVEVAEVAPSADDAAFLARFGEMQERVHAIAVDNGWYDDVDASDTLPFVTRSVANFHSEVSEAWDAYVKGDQPSETVEGYSQLETELADLVIRVMDSAEWLGLNLGGAIVAKSAYNKTRDYRHGGKKA